MWTISSFCVLCSPSQFTSSRWSFLLQVVEYCHSDKFIKQYGRIYSKWYSKFTDLADWGRNYYFILGLSLCSLATLIHLSGHFYTWFLSAQEQPPWLLLKWRFSFSWFLSASLYVCYTELHLSFQFLFYILKINSHSWSLWLSSCVWWWGRLFLTVIRKNCHKPCTMTATLFSTTRCQ